MTSSEFTEKWLALNSTEQHNRLGVMLTLGSKELPYFYTSVPLLKSLTDKDLALLLCTNPPDNVLADTLYNIFSITNSVDQLTNIFSNIKGMPISLNHAFTTVVYDGDHETDFMELRLWALDKIVNTHMRSEYIAKLVRTIRTIPTKDKSKIPAVILFLNFMESGYPSALSFISAEVSKQLINTLIEYNIGSIGLYKLTKNIELAPKNVRNIFLRK